MREMIEVRRNSGKQQAVDTFLGQLINQTPPTLEIENMKDIREAIRRRFNDIEEKYTCHGKRWDRFPASFISQKFVLGVEVEESEESEESADEAGPAKKGRPAAQFDCLSPRQKYNRLTIFENYESQELLAATKRSLHKEGEKSAVNVLSNLENSPSRGKRLSKTIANCPSTSFSNEQALSMMYKLNLGVEGYKYLKQMCAVSVMIFFQLITK